MPSGPTRVLRLALQAPRLGKLAYCLFRDQRVPSGPKVALAGGLGVIFSPIDIPAWIPVIGELDAIALSVLAVRLFVDACPEELVEEQRQAIKAGDSTFDRDLRTVVGVVREGARTIAVRLRQRLRSRRQGRPEEPALKAQTA